MSNINFLISTNDYFLVPLYLIIISIVAFVIRSQNTLKYPEYKFFVSGIIFKLIGVSFFIIVYLFYYNGGDTVNYFKGTTAIANLLNQNFNAGINVLFNTNSPLNDWYSFNSGTGFPPHYMWKDANTFSVCRFSLPFFILGSNSFIVTSFLTACFSYIGIWKLFRLFNILYPGNERIFSYIMLYLPTLIFWGGGIMKDSFVLGATCWITYNFYKIFIDRRKVLLNVIFLFFNLLLIINIKSYIIISLLPGMLIWLNNSYLKSFNNAFVKVFIFPFIILSFSIVGYFSINSLSSLMGVYGGVDTAIEQAQIIQDDLSRVEQYGGNNYDIGEIENSFSGIIRIAPIAVLTALFRPFLWEIGSPTMVFSAIENTILIVFTFLIFIRTNPFKLMRIIFREPFLAYCFVFSILFAFGVGIAGTNFGALVRYKIPLMPFFFCMLFIVRKLTKANSD